MADPALVLYNSPIGELRLGACDGKLCLCDWANRTERPLCRQVARTCGHNDKLLYQTCAQLDEYFAGCRHDFTIAITLSGTDFQRHVWEALSHIKYGETTTYSNVAHRIGRPDAVRAVAAAIGANPLSIFIPCHRIVGASGSLTGYAGGLDAKQFLLNLECAAPPQVGIFRKWPTDYLSES